MGRLTRDPEIRYSQGTNATCIAKFSLAVNRRFKRDGEPDADFFNCTAFGKAGETVEKFLRKGTKICVHGEIRNDTYEKDGVKHYATNIIVDQFDFCESKSSNGSAPAANNDGFMNVPTGIDDELPFA